ncbi:hypothetical protein ACJMK2_040443 [Sinanodonta woodiana]|uniref:Uncharacterized protein n=1 Tax=Sinanodonta woodiana TaxID=1069815 RepID=A0ABD3W1L1_SINWO
MALMLAWNIISKLWKGKPTEKSKSTSIDSSWSLEITQSNSVKLNGSLDITQFTSVKSNGSLDITQSTNVKLNTSLAKDPSKYQEKRRCSEDPERQLKKLQEQMWLALEQFETSMEFQALWIAVESELRELDEYGIVPETDMNSAGLDQNNSDHFCKAFADIEDQFKEQRYEIALSRLKACRSVFIDSHLHRVQDIFMEDNFTILKKLFFKSYLD